MKINVKKRDEVKFSDLCAGDVFKGIPSEVVYMKVYHESEDGAVNLATGTLLHFAQNAECIPLRAELEAFE